MNNSGWVCLLLGALVCSSANSAEPETLKQLNQFYDNLQVCSTAQVTSTQASNTGLTVNLAVETQTATAIKNMRSPEQAHWMALHCPPEYPYFYKPDSPIDVKIHALTEKSRFATLSCQQYYGNMHIQTQEKVTNKLNQIHYRLQQLKN